MTTDTIARKYRIVREIARSNDVVYEAFDTAMDRRIAVKVLVLPPNLTGAALQDRISRFNREARAAGRLSHPNIVTVYDFGQDEGQYFIAMEYLEGITLRDRMQMGGALPMKEAVDIASQVLLGLAHAHRYKVIHRDVKPDNIHILPGGLVKLTDFGIARLTEEASLTADGQVFGTPSYMSPEQIAGSEIDHRTDLFSVGVVTYEMLTGRKPFVGDNVVSITYNIMYSAPPAMSPVSPAIEQVVFRALSKSPQQRPPSADEMRTDLKAAEADALNPVAHGLQVGTLYAPGTVLPADGMARQAGWPQGLFGSGQPAPTISTSAAQTAPAQQPIAGPFATWGPPGSTQAPAPPPLAAPRQPYVPPRWLIDLKARLSTLLAVLLWAAAISAVVVGFLYLFTTAFSRQRDMATPPGTSGAQAAPASVQTGGGGEQASSSQPQILSGDLAAAQSQIDAGDRLWANDQPAQAVDKWLSACEAPIGSQQRQTAMNRLSDAARLCYKAGDAAYQRGDLTTARQMWDASRRALPGSTWSQRAQDRWDQTAPASSP